jgi:hypothetical protein
MREYRSPSFPGLTALRRLRSLFQAVFLGYGGEAKFGGDPVGRGQ